jgi:hypothetical protein
MFEDTENYLNIVYLRAGLNFARHWPGLASPNRLATLILLPPELAHSSAASDTSGGNGNRLPRRWKPECGRGCMVVLLAG